MDSAPRLPLNSLCRWAAWAGLWGICASSSWAQDDGLNPTGRWTPRLSPQYSATGQLHSVAALTDYSVAPAQAPGLRVTGGWIWGLGNTRMASTDSATGIERAGLAATLPQRRSQAYLGVGYTGTSVLTGWRLHADLGFTWRLNSEPVKLGNTGQATALEDVLREARFAPLLHLSARYSF